MYVQIFYPDKTQEYVHISVYRASVARKCVTLYKARVKLDGKSFWKDDGSLIQ